MRPRRGAAGSHALLAALAVVLLAVGCAAPAHRAAPFSARTLDADALVGQCARLLGAFEEAVLAAAARDGGPAPVPGHPYLRADRAAAHLYGSDAPAALAAARALDAEGRALELARLPPPARAALAARAGGAPADLPAALEGCAERLRTADTARGEQPRALAVPDDYDTWKRVAGLYWLTRVPFAIGVRGYQADTLAVFRTPLERLPVRGTLQRFAPGEGAAPEGLDAALVRRHAPVLEVDVATSDDRIGTLAMDAGGQPVVDVRRPAAYVRTATTQVGGRWLRQLVYTFWFPARPSSGAIDLLGGHLDGLVWRVTLDEAGEPWVYDTIHPCGCYHQFFPTPGARPRPAPQTLDETAFVPQSLPAVGPEQRIVLRVASGSHYLQRVVVSGESPAGLPYEVRHERELRALPLPGGGVASLYRADGMVPGTERGERWLFWPMGVREPGAMRQWGRQATAFVGRRHFDDPCLLDRAFERAPQ
ncbi:MAG: hypothetical protein ACK5YW_09625 [Betaproteobacteria bacterium]